MNPIAAAVLVFIGLSAMSLSVYVVADEVRCYRRRDTLSGLFGVALILVGLTVAASCFAAFRMMI